MQLSNEDARALKTIIADMRALPVASLLEALAEVSFSSEGKLDLMISDNLSLTAFASHLENPCNTDGSVNWSRVSRIKVHSIGKNE